MLSEPAADMADMAFEDAFVELEYMIATKSTQKDAFVVVVVAYWI